jgi:hypothetical protein
LKKVKFWGGILFSENQTTFATTNPDPNEPVYVGPPTDAMDDAWYALSHSMLFKHIVSIRAPKQLISTFMKTILLLSHPKKREKFPIDLRMISTGNIIRSGRSKVLIFIKGNAVC